MLGLLIFVDELDERGSRLLPAVSFFTAAFDPSLGTSARPDLVGANSERQLGPASAAAHLTSIDSLRLLVGSLLI